MSTDPTGKRFKLVVMCDWTQVPHLTPEAQARMLAGTPPWQRDARSKGIPQLGSGAVFPIPESEIKVEDFQIPKHYVRGYGMDVGWQKTAGIWRAHDRETGVSYLYSQHYRGQAEPSIHAEAFKARGRWIPGKIDPAAHGRSQVDGKQLFSLYQAQGLNLSNAANAREAGLQEIWEQLSTGRLKVFASLTDWFAEYRLFRRDEKGRIIDEHKFHLMAATRYAILSGVDWLITQPSDEPVITTSGYSETGTAGLGWMG
jgi:hypothetical protein